MEIIKNILVATSGTLAVAGAPYEPVINDNFPGWLPYSQVNMNMLVFAPAISPYNCYNMPPPTITLAPPSADPAAVEALEEQISTEYDSPNIEIAAEYDFNNKDAAYRDAKSNPEMINSSEFIEEFVMENENTNIGKFTEVESKIAKGELPYAEALLNGITPQLNSEINYKLFYELYMRYQRGTLDASDSIAIDSLAYQCPELGGMAVYQFETLRSMVFGDYNSTVYHCEIADPVSAMRVANAPTAIKMHDEINEGKVIIAPNPSNGNFNIQATYLQNSSAQCEIYSVDGKILFDESIQFNGGVANLNTKLIAGIYSIKIIERKQTTTHKILIK